MVFQLMLLGMAFLKGIHKYFLLRELNLLERYGTGSWVVITGASSGQGYEMALAFAKRGFNLLMIGSKRTDETARQITAEYPTIKTRVIHKDFRMAFRDGFFKDIEAAFTEIGPDLAILINNVGHRVGWNPYHEMKADYIRDVVATGTLVQSRLTHMAIPYFLQRANAVGANAVGANGEEPWSFYIIENKGCTYAGVSPDPVKRLRKHNGEISGGAKYTQSKGPGWRHVCLVHGFQTKTQALQFEWAVKHVPPRDSGGLVNRIKKLYTVLNKKNWTSKSPEASTVPLQLEWKIANPLSGTLPPYISSISVPQLK